MRVPVPALDVVARPNPNVLRPLRALGASRTAAVLLVAFALAVLLEKLWPPVAALAAARLLGALVVASLVAALLVHPRTRRGALGVFHVGLLVLVATALAGRAARYEGRVEVTTGTDFEPAAVEVVRQGRWHGKPFAQVAFRQGEFEVDYTRGMRRGRTTSRVSLPDGAAVVGDDRPLVVDGYRFYTTHNKGFAPVLEWSAPGRGTLTGAIHMPSYPLFDWKQSNEWVAPDGSVVRVWLDVRAPADASAAWRLRSDDCRCALVVEVDGVRSTLAPGGVADLGGGARLRVVEMRGWMGYRVFYDPTLPWLLVAAFTCCGGLAWHFATTLPARLRASATDVRSRRATAEMPT